MFKTLTTKSRIPTRTINACDNVFPNIFNDFGFLSEDINNVFTDFNNAVRDYEKYLPATKRKEKEDGTIDYVFKVPGIEKENLNLSLDKEYLIVFGETEDKEKISYKQYVGPDVIVNKAILKNGLLAVNIKHKEDIKKEIKIQIE